MSRFGKWLKIKEMLLQDLYSIKNFKSNSIV